MATSGVERLDVQQAIAATDQPRVFGDQVGAEQAMGRQVGHAQRGGLEREPDGEVGVLFELQRPRLAVLAGASKIVAEAGADVTHPGSADLAHTAGADQLIEQHVRDRADQLEVSAPLADQLVAGGERNERFERHAHGHASAVWNVSLDGLGHGAHAAHLGDLCHARQRKRLSASSQPGILRG